MARPIPIKVTSTCGIPERDMIAMYLATGALKITRYPEARRENLSPRRGGGAMPAHLNPLLLGRTREEVEQIERERARG